MSALGTSVQGLRASIYGTQSGLLIGEWGKDHGASNAMIRRPFRSIFLEVNSMKMVKSLLLGTAALVAGSFSAQAADLAAAEPVEYVKICDAYGAGYFFIPGSSDTCLRISGFVRAYFAYQSRNANNDQTRGSAFAQGGNGFGNGIGELTVPTLVNAINPLTGAVVTGAAGLVGTSPNYANYGVNGVGLLATPAAAGNFLVRGNDELRDQYISGIRALLRFDARTKTEWGILRSFFEFAANSNNNAKNGDPLVVRYGFVQFGPLTAGITDSFFNYDLTESFLSPIGDRPTRLPVLAYTASLGNGISVTLAAEDSGAATGFGGSTGLVISGAAASGGASAAWTRRSVQLPDGVANIRVAQSWGTAQVGAAVSQYRFANTACSLAVNVTTVCTSNKVGWAVGGGVNINLPALAKGDSLLVKATYAEGSLQYLGNVSSQGYFGNGVVGFDNGVRTRRGWAVAAQLNHFFTPAIRAAVIGGYTRLDTNPGVNFGGNAAYLREAWNVYGQLFWTPVRGFDVGVELFYQEGTYNYYGGTALGNRVLGNASDQSWGGYFRVQRSF